MSPMKMRKAWYRGRYEPPASDSSGGVIIIFLVYYERPWAETLIDGAVAFCRARWIGIATTVGAAAAVLALFK